MIVNMPGAMYTYIREIKPNGSSLDLYKKLAGEDHPAVVVATVDPADILSIVDDNRGQ